MQLNQNYVTPGKDAPVVKVFFVLGGPGSGKGTVCKRLAEGFGMIHLSPGDLLRAEAKKDTALGQFIKSVIDNGKLVPGETTLQLLKNAIMSHEKAAEVENSISADLVEGIPRPKQRIPQGYLIDGFPRRLDQAKDFEEKIFPPAGIIYLRCSEECMKERLLGRRAEGRADDNEEAILKRFRVNQEECEPVVQMYHNDGILQSINAGQSKEDVYHDVRETMIVTYNLAPIKPHENEPLYKDETESEARANAAANKAQRMANLDRRDKLNGDDIEFDPTTPNYFDDINTPEGGRNINIWGASSRTMPATTPLDDTLKHRGEVFVIPETNMQAEFRALPQQQRQQNSSVLMRSSFSPSLHLLPIMIAPIVFAIAAGFAGFTKKFPKRNQTPSI